jgi:lipopolysaccharide transport system ATP-binding protein
MTDTVISAENVSKYYKLGAFGGKTLQEDFQRWWAKLRGKPDPLLKVGDGQNNVEGGNLWSLRDVSFDVKQGEVLGIIGRNGAGKSTLLKVISKITAPTSGEIKINGRVGSLLEVGTGFHPELTGRENIYLNGSILGMKKKEIDGKFDEIVEFSEMTQFVDTPVKRYSSGMRVRLAFAVAAHLEPEILVIDEVLAVGDAEFQRKCLGKMNEVAGEGRTVLFVSHQMGAIRGLCDRTLLITSGKISFDGNTDQAINQYLNSTKIETGLSEWLANDAMRETESIYLVAVRVLDSQDHCRKFFMSNEIVVIELDVYIRQKPEHFKMSIQLETASGEVVFFSSHNDVQDLPVLNGQDGLYQFRVFIPESLLNTNTYSVSVSSSLHKKRSIFRHERIVQFEVKHQIPNLKYMIGKRPGSVSPLLEWNAKLLKD